MTRVHFFSAPLSLLLWSGFIGFVALFYAWAKYGWLGFGLTAVGVLLLTAASYVAQAVLFPLQASNDQGQNGWTLRNKITVAAAVLLLMVLLFLEWFMR